MFFNNKSPWHKEEQPHFSGSFEYATRNIVSRKVWHNAGVKVSFDEKGWSIIHADFDRLEAMTVFFGVEEQEGSGS